MGNVYGKYRKIISLPNQRCTETEPNNTEKNRSFKTTTNILSESKGVKSHSRNQMLGKQNDFGAK